jgi:repressor LexA
VADEAVRVLFELGRRVAELRVKRSLTQEDLAELLGVTPRYVQSIEAGRQNLSVRSLVKLARALDARLPDLFSAPHGRAVRLGRPRKRR